MHHEEVNYKVGARIPHAWPNGSGVPAFFSGATVSAGVATKSFDLRWNVNGTPSTSSTALRSSRPRIPWATFVA